MAFLAAGGNGCISVTANIAPKLCADMHRAWREGRIADAIAIQDQLVPLHDAMFCEPSPAPAKYGASLLGHCTPEVRLPLVELTDAGRVKVKDAMQACGLKV